MKSAQMLSYSPRETFRLFSHLPPQRLIHQPGLISLTSSTHPSLVYFPPSPRLCPGQSCCHLSSWQTERCSLAPSLLFLLSSGSFSMRQLESSISNGNQTALAPAGILQGLSSHQAFNKTTEPSPANGYPPGGPLFYPPPLLLNSLLPTPLVLSLACPSALVAHSAYVTSSGSPPSCPKLSLFISLYDHLIFFLSIDVSLCVLSKLLSIRI